MDQSRNHTEHNPVEAFIDRWRDTGGKERANYQLFLTELREPLNNSARARRRLCGWLRLGLGKRDLVVPNKRVQTSRRPRKGPSRKGFAGKAASRASRPSAVAMATVTRLAPHDLRLFRLKRAPRRVVQRFLSQLLALPGPEPRSHRNKLEDLRDEHIRQRLVDLSMIRTEESSSKTVYKC